MPRHGPTVCGTPGCPNLATARGHCPDHQPGWHHEESAHERGYGQRWRAVRRRILRNEPVCRTCQQAPATDVDHIVPKHLGGTDDPTNLQPLCHSCHRQKSLSEAANARRLAGA